MNLIVRKPDCTSGKGGLAIRHICGNLEQAHNCTNNNTPPICIASFFDALQRCLYSQANVALPQLYCLALLMGLRSCRGMSETWSADQSMNNRASIQTSRWQQACYCTTSSLASTTWGAANHASSHLYLILTPLRQTCLSYVSSAEVHGPTTVNTTNSSSYLSSQ